MRRPERQLEGEEDRRRTRAHKESSAREPLPLDLNLSMSDDHIDTIGDSGGEGSRNSSSDLTMEHDQDYGRPAPARCPPSNVSELIKAVDGVVVFKPVNLEPLKRCGASPTWCRRKTGGTTTGCEAAVVDPVILVGLIFYLTKLKW